MATNSDVPESAPDFGGIPVIEDERVERGEIILCAPSAFVEDVEPEHRARAAAEGWVLIDVTKHPDETVDEYIERLHASDARITEAYDASQWYGASNDTAPPLRHPNSARFHQLLEIAGETHDRKQADYGAGDDPFANVRASEAWGIPGWVGAMVRLNDKVKRLQSLQDKGYLANESALDSFMDIAVYALIAYVLYEQAAEEGTL